MNSGGSAVGAARLGREAAQGEWRQHGVDRLGVAAVEVEGVFGQAQLPDLVGTVDRLRRIVEDVEDIVPTVEQQPVERRQPARIEVLPLIDHDRVVPRPERPDRVVEPAGQRLLEPFGSHGLRLGGQRAGHATEVLGQLVEGAHIEPAGSLRHVSGLVGEDAREG